jgi:hypothetical protein
MPTTVTPIRPDEQPSTTHARGRWFYGVLVGIWPLALAIGAVGVAFGLPLGITLGSALAVALAVDFLTIVAAFEVDDGDTDLDDVP